VNIAIFASGTGTNAAEIIRYFKGHNDIHVNLIVVNKSHAGVFKVAENNQVPAILINKDSFYNESFLEVLGDYKIDFIVLAGFLWLIPSYLVKAFEHKMLNIHPALLPKYGGKGMYGEKVHQAVIQNKEKESGITIHFVNEQFDEGEIVFQEKCEVSELDTPTTLAQKIHQLEHKNFSRIIEKVMNHAN
jgi:phosphoribosylglycinamide formyltransferase 1